MMTKKTIIILTLIMSTLLLSGCEFDRDTLTLEGKCNYDVAHNYCQENNMSYISYSDSFKYGGGLVLKCETSCGVIKKIRLHPICDIKIISK